MAEDPTPRIEDVALAPLRTSTWRWRMLVGALVTVVAVGTVGYVRQLQNGLAVTGMATTTNKVMWGVYITNFVFFIGISHAGTLISAILRVSHARWRTPITRMAEFITVVALSVGALFPLIDLGRPDRLLNVIRYGRWESPILWDFFAVTTYFVGSVLYLYLPLIPDLAECRDELEGSISSRRTRVYRTLAVGWTGLPEQRRHLLRALGLMMIVIIPVAISVHTVVSWIFAMTLRTGWNTAVFGIYFVAGAIFSGIGVLIIVMAILRKVCHFEAFVTAKQFVNLGYLLAALGLIMVYFNVSELLNSSYKMATNERIYLRHILTGSFAPLYWLYMGLLLVPGIVMLSPRLRRMGPIILAAAMVVVAMWIERYVIVVASLEVPQTPYHQAAHYVPTGVEIAITAAALALFALLITLFVRFVPAISIWEVREHHENEAVVPEPSSVPAGLAPVTPAA